MNTRRFIHRNIVRILPENSQRPVRWCGKGGRNAPGHHNML